MYDCPLAITYGDKVTVLNLHILISQGLAGDDEAIENLKALNYERMVLEEGMENTNPLDIYMMTYYVNMIEAIDYQLQGIWGFDEDNTRHRFWELPHCTCPNGEDNLGSEVKQIDINCLVHGL